MNQKNSKASAQTKQNLIDAFWSLYSVMRIEKTTVKEICSKAGYNRSTFYEYFTDSYDVLEQIENSLLPSLEELPPISMKLEESHTAIDFFLKMYSEHKKYYTVLLGDNGDPAFSGKLKNNVKQMLMSHLSTHEKNKDDELDYTLEFILSAMIGILTYWFKNNENMPHEQLLALMYKLMGNDLLKSFNLISAETPPILI